MLYTSTIAPSTLELLKRIMNDEAFSRFVLVGGTSLALLLGHRISVDLDLFTDEPFDELQLLEHIRTHYPFELDFLSKETVKGEITGVQIDCIAHKYPWLAAPLVENEIRIARFEDIAAMKLNAIIGNGTRIKDFIDVAYLSEKMPLKAMMDAYEKKYRSNPVLVLKALVYFDDVYFDEPISLTNGKRFNWKKVRQRLEEMVKMPGRIFPNFTV